jgi:N-acetylmuramoyl-L-alanine amidase
MVPDMRALIALLLALCVAVAAPAAVVKNVRAVSEAQRTRVVFDLDGPLEHTLFMLKNPDRVVVDLRATRLAVRLPGAPSGDRFLTSIRAGTRPQGDTRVVFDLKQGARPKSFLLKPEAGLGHRLVVDLLSASAVPAQPPARGAPRRSVPREVIIAIDPGHGGVDPGAIGPARTKEKVVALAVANRLKLLIDHEPGMSAFLTRKGDYFVPLRKRMEIARAQDADLFVSLHADAFRDKRVRGSSVFILSRGGASSEAARWLAAQENAADLVGGVSLDDKDEQLAKVLLDLSQTATISASTAVAQRVLGGLKRIGPTHKPHVERANFMVLKSPDIPSILVEMAFLTNPLEERKLRSPLHQRKVALAVLSGIKVYFGDNPPPGTLFARRRHVIESGDTLSGIASRYGVSVSDLRAVNALQRDVVKVGEVLRIPTGS